MSQRTHVPKRKSQRLPQLVGAASDGRRPHSDTPRPSPPGQLPAGFDAEPEALVVNHWFDPGEEGEPYPATIRLTGHRAGVGGKPKPSDTFVHEEALDQVVPGSGPVSVASWVYGLQPGEWSIVAELIRPRADGRGRRMADAARPDTQQLRVATWSWRNWALLPGPASVVLKTRWALLARLARIPAVMPGSIPALVAIGTLILLALQMALLSNRGVSGGTTLLVSAIAALFGLLAAKLWHKRLNPHESILRAGWAVDGFMVVAPLAAIGASLALNVPIAAYLDATTPGLFFTVALGRVGCFLTGCCAGRATASRLGVWCSNQRIGARRIPTQLFESATGLALGLTTLAVAIGTGLLGSGVIFVAAITIYLLIRQFLLRMRAEPRRYLWQRRRLEQAL